MDVLQGTGPWHLYAVIQQCDMRKPVCTVGVLSDTQTSFGFGLLFSAIKSMTLIADFSNSFRNWTPTCTFEFWNALRYHTWNDFVPDWRYPHWLPLNMVPSVCFGINFPPMYWETSDRGETLTAVLFMAGHRPLVLRKATNISPCRFDGSHYLTGTIHFEDLTN